MRDYAKISPQFWTGDTGKGIKKLGAEAQVLALYLISSPHANMYGVYYLPISFICYETGLSEEGALKGLERLSEGGFCLYDPQKEYIWVIEMARFQIGEQLKAGDNNIKAVNKFYESLPNLLFLEEIFDRYQANFHLKNRRENRSPFKAPSKPHRSQEQEQEQEIEKKDITTPSSSKHSLVGDFFALFAAEGFYVNKLNGSPDTVDMVRAWIAAGVTVEEARAVIEQTNAKRSKRPGSPSYYRNIVLDAKRAGIIVIDESFQEEIKKLFHEILPENPINAWTDKAKQDLQARINGSYKNFDGTKLDSWRNFFLLVKCSSHIKKHEWYLDYLVREEIFANILNGKRHNTSEEIEKYKALKAQHANSTEEKKQ